jgi:hypothetical protein
MCSACAGDYENPDMTAPEADFDVLAPAAGGSPPQGEIVPASERLRAAIEELARLEYLELQFLREAVRVTRQASEALEVVCRADARAKDDHAQNARAAEVRATESSTGRPSESRDCGASD